MLVAIVVIVAALGSESLLSSRLPMPSPSTVRSTPAAPSTSAAPSPSAAPSTPAAPSPARSRSTEPSRSPAAPPLDRSRDQQGDALGAAGGAVPDGTTVFDDDVPGVANLDPALLRALRRAATDAEADGVTLLVDSGWRTPAYQARLLREAISKYGSDREAARWVATPDTSAHVSGDAVDIGPRAAATWLSQHGATYGLCQTYRNEPWHYELRADAVTHGCPRMYADPTQDPRMQR